MSLDVWDSKCIPVYLVIYQKEKCVNQFLNNVIERLKKTYFDSSVLQLSMKSSKTFQYFTLFTVTYRKAFKQN